MTKADKINAIIAHANAIQELSKELGFEKPTPTKKSRISKKQRIKQFENQEKLNQ